MDIHVRRRNDTFIRMSAHRRQNPEDFPAASVETEQMDVIDEVVESIARHSSDQQSRFGEVRFQYGGKGTARENLRESVDEIGGIAPAMAYEFPNIDLLFHVKRNLTDAEMLALGRAFYTKSADYEAAFIRYKLDPDFRKDLKINADAFEASLQPPEMAKDAQVEATAQLGESVRRGMIAWRILRGVMKVKYKNNPAKYRAWLSASNIEKDSPKKDVAENDNKTGEGGDNQPNG